ncbi:hypothetical protein UAY_00148 [Enterococcus moraviensis ATCC BAA-383]|uniref:Uncharacterized protein n=1 Tax=Enterococcus moraviensis ATCC BAA-383 TaxID=1158609 RepID=R2RGM0_9ENTE|nr:hypothetical protein UAY_00148 [Enterococcus moraviensis ATCC BAA-383]EOT65149.1 hypothetical protein I586_02883 [Enterococcus moraviensis ATCC BAA-383]
MTITEQDYKKLSEIAYWIDPKHEDYKSHLITLNTKFSIPNTNQKRNASNGRRPNS